MPTAGESRAYLVTVWTCAALTLAAWVGIIATLHLSVPVTTPAPAAGAVGAVECRP
jgi:hypothetical protein